jgi:hypothetical protein
MAETHLEFVLHVIPPPMRLDWTTPRSLFVSTFLNHLRGDKAPIGHLYVEFSLPTQAGGSFHPKIASALSGARRIITGMSRKKMTMIESIKVVQGKKLGLGTFYYDFKGKLDSVEEAQEEISWAKKRKRHATIRVKISEEKAEQMLDFLKDWIERGSFRHYSGGLRVDCGEGAGCAEFGMHFLGMALGLHAVNPDWMRRVRVPHELIGGGFAGHSERISIWNIFKDGDRWAYGSEPHHVYSIPDPELVFDWIKDHPSVKDATEWNARLIPGEITWNSGEFVRREFQVDYPVESLGSIQEQWARVVEK